MMRRTLGRALLVAWAIFWTAGAARAQSTDPYAATYCEPDPQTKLIYTNRAYLILPKAPDTPALRSRPDWGWRSDATCGAPMKTSSS